MRRTINRRALLSAAGGVLTAAALPRWAVAAMPTPDEVALDPEIPALGNPEGSVTVVEFVDYQCPYCKLAYGEIAKLLAEDPDVRVVLRDWPIFGAGSIYAARAVVACVPETYYPAVVAGLMDNKRNLSKRRVRSIVADAGVRQNLDELIASRRAGIDELLHRTNRQARAFGLTGTPGLLVGSVLYKHGLRLENLRKAVAFARTGEGRFPT